MKGFWRKKRAPLSIQGTLRRSFFRVTLMSTVVLFMLLSVPPLIGRLLQSTLEEHLQVVQQDASSIISLLKNLPLEQQAEVLEGLNSGQMQLLKKDSPQNAGQIYIGAFQVDVFTQNDQVTLIDHGRVIWSQGLQKGPVPEGWKPHLQTSHAVTFQEQDPQVIRRLLKDVPAWVSQSLNAATLITPLGREQFLAVTAFQPRSEILTAVMVLLYLVILLTWAFLIALPATLGSVVVSSVYAGREARTLSRPIEALSKVARSIAAGNLKTRVEPQGPRELQDLARDINTISENLSRSMQQLQDALDHQKDFLQSISHDLRTPLSHILAFSEDLSHRLEQEAHLKKARIIHREALALGRMVDDLFDLLRFEHPGFRLQLQAVQLDTVVTSCALSFAKQAQEKGIRLFVLPAEPLLVQADPDRLRQVLSNLINNALQHTPEGGNISLTVQRKDGQAEVQVQDTGSGISPEHLPHVFERFYRAEASRAERHAGLGLTISRELIQRMQGSITVNSVKGEGSTFSVFLPISPGNSPQV
ncbi:sensor histidine kinase [Deinococcus cellulosilyticus]|uniref:histidine kinase n=1 Tax=Deinococcus cellulosilyticus (strain DSM 18568 / NBRC 106333 / KACC 11606 / 5516J-15) TaxID=1223518 RepID=A0A511MV85_DEIC1|nr:HAMP domain-containing sensor histidine kinase [Deinococcus cellulosilyticus]GEM44490.1 hypothetical protein DC3_01250 [Deinococcus cellulosilyticus NBRC 106333 = KACC 11606]